MIRTLWDATNTFGIQSAEGLARKAWREYVRAKDASNDEDQRDSILNCAISAWHVCDWAWFSITDAGRTRPEFAQVLGVAGRNPTKDDLVFWAVRSCPDLQICQSICNGTKHVRSSRPIGTLASEPNKTSKLSTFTVEDKGTQREIMPILFDVVNFWGYQVTNAGTMK